MIDLPFAFGGPPVGGEIRCRPEDFQVDEIPAFTADGSGEHCLLQIEKRNCNTDWIAGRLADLAGVPRRDVGYAGLKDRNAVTRQWFSVRLAGRAEPHWGKLDGETIRVLETVRHGRKLRIGALRGNRFRILVRTLQGDTGALQRNRGSPVAPAESAGTSGGFISRRPAPCCSIWCWRPEWQRAVGIVPYPANV